MGEGKRTYGLSSVLREIICRKKGPSHARIELRVAVIHGIDDGVLESAGIFNDGGGAAE